MFGNFPGSKISDTSETDFSDDDDNDEGSESVMILNNDDDIDKE